MAIVWLAKLPVGAQTLTTGYQNVLPVPQIEILAIEINCRATKSHSVDINVLTMPRCRPFGDEVIASAHNRFPGDQQKKGWCPTLL